MYTEKIRGEWWILPESYGPYDTKAEAESDRRGIERFRRDFARAERGEIGPEWISVDSKPA